MGDPSFLSFTSTGTCQDSGTVYWRGALVVKPTLAFDPVAWFNSGALSSPDFKEYLKSQVLPGVAVPLALFGLVLVFTLLFVLWRLFTCCGCCKEGGDAHLHQDDLYSNPLKLLRNPWLKAYQVLLVICGCAAVGLAIYGMVTLPRHPFNDTVAQADNAIQYANGVLSQVDTALAAVNDISQSLNGVQRTLDVDVDAPAILSQLQVLEPFVTGIQDMSPAARSLQALQSLLTQQLEPVLLTLQALVNNAATELLPAVQQVAALQSLTTVMRSSVSQYTTQLRMLAPEFSPAAMFTVGFVKQAQSQLRLPEWRAQVQAAQEALTQVEQARDTGLLPGITTGCSVLVEAQQKAAPDMDLVAAGLQTLADLHPETLVKLLPDLIDRMQHINDTVVLLDTDTNRSYGLVQVALASIENLYPSNSTGGSRQQSTGPGAGSGLSLDLDAWLDQARSLSDTLRDTSQANALSQALAEPTDRLSNAPSTTPLKAALQNVVSYMVAAQPLVDAVEQALAVHMDREDAESYMALKNQADIVLGYTDAVEGGLTSLQTSDSYAFVLTALNLNNSVEVLSQRAAESQASIQDALDHIQTFESGQGQQLRDTLQVVNQFVAMLPDSRAQVLEAPRALLRDAIQKAEDGMAGVRARVQDANSKVQYHVENLRSNVLPRVEQRKSDVADQLNYYWDRMYIGLMAGYALVILFMVVLGCVAVVRCPSGVLWSTLFLLAMVLVWLAVALVTTAAMVVLQDACNSAERIILTKLTDTSKGVPLGEFYLAGQATPDGIRGVLKSMSVVDINQLVDGMTESQNDLLDSLQSTWQVQPWLSAGLLDVTTAVEGAQAQINSAVSLLEYGPVHGLYLGIKTEACCDLGARLLVLWICTTGSGLFAWLACVFAKFVLGHMDSLPRENWAGCFCYREDDYKTPTERQRRHFLLSWGGRLSSQDAPAPPMDAPNPADIEARMLPGSANTSLGGSAHEGADRRRSSVANFLQRWFTWGHDPHLPKPESEIQMLRDREGTPGDGDSLQEAPSAPPMAELSQDAQSQAGTEGEEAEGEGEGTPRGRTVHLFAWPTPPVRVARVDGAGTPRDSPTVHSARGRTEEQAGDVEAGAEDEVEGVAAAASQESVVVVAAEVAQQDVGTQGSAEAEQVAVPMDALVLPPLVVPVSMGSQGSGAAQGSQGSVGAQESPGAGVGVLPGSVGPAGATVASPRVRSPATAVIRVLDAATLDEPHP